MKGREKRGFEKEIEAQLSAIGTLSESKQMMTKTVPKKQSGSVTMPDLNPKPSHIKHFSGSNHEQFSLMLVNQFSAR